MRPILSEKSNELREAEGKYIFEVRREASKDEIKKAIIKLWDVKVEKVATSIRRGKVKRRGANITKLSNTKRAYVTLAKGAKLPLFEDQ